MKTICTVITVLAATCSCAAAAVDRSAANDHIRQEAAALVRRGDAAQARHRLGSTLPPAARGAATSLDVGQQWLLLAYNFRRSGEAQLARFAASEAVSIATRLSGSDASASERASFLTGVGLLCERILYDLPQAKSFYDAALLVQPNDGEAKNRQRTADAKLKQRGRTQTGKQ
jgi:hypothetical protein